MFYSIDHVFSRFSRIEKTEQEETTTKGSIDPSKAHQSLVEDRISPPEQKLSAEKLWVNETRENNLVELQQMLSSPTKARQVDITQLRPVVKNLCSQGVSVALFYVAGGLLNKLGVESGQFGQVGLYALGDLLREQKMTIEELFLDRILGEPERDFQQVEDCRLLKSVHQMLVAKDRAIFGSYSEDIKNSLSAFDKRFMSDFCADGKSMRAQLFAREGLLKAIPNIVQDVSHQSVTGNPASREIIDRRVKELVGRYPIEMQGNLRAFISRIRANCFKNVPQFAGAYLYGKPGTGKTYFARNLAKALDLPMFEFSLDNNVEQGLMGIGNWPVSMSDDSITRREELAVGKLACTVIKSGILNPIIYFDEGGDSLRSLGTINLMKRLLDPESQRRVMGALGGAVIDFSRVTYMISGNDPLQNEALKRRIKEIEFGSLPIEAKKRVILEELDSKVANHSNLSEDIFREFEKHVRGSFDEIVRQDTVQKSPGVAVAQQVIEDVVNYITDVLLAAEPVDTDELNEVIEDGFAQRLPRMTNS